MASASSETDYVTLISNDGFSFVVQRSAATISPMVRKMLDPQSMCSTHEMRVLNQQHFVRKSGIVLEKVCEYFYYNERNKDARDVQDMDFPTELCLEILMAADYLDV
ncbi:hypothetical protein D0866_03502 [Hortaea werneckii]|uniref:Elongin-C n=1 Tax=Hortaea werneckii TaxID=91943 RepID=A0A3M7BB62_HORWE|nr:hypothetical protein D0866_03502 [Hortaea werneckii]